MLWTRSWDHMRLTAFLHRRLTIIVGIAVSLAVLPAAPIALAGGSGVLARPVGVTASTPSLPRPIFTPPVHMLGASAVTSQPSADPPTAPTADPPLVYGGGPVMGVGPGAVMIHPIYWAPNGYAFPSGFRSTMDGFLADVAAGSGQSNNVFAVATQYYQVTNGVYQYIHYQIQAATQATDTNGYPSGPGGCAPDTTLGFSVCITASQLTSEVTSYLAVNSLPAGYSNVYPLFLPPNVETCFSSLDTLQGGTCSSGATTGGYCAYHSWSTTSIPEIYAIMPYGTYCGPYSYDGSVTATEETSVVVHEVIESVTDPIGTGWRDPNGNEVADECVGDFASQTFGTTQWMIQKIFSNADFAQDPSGGCVSTNTVPITITTRSLPQAVVGTPYSAQLVASGGFTPYSWAITAGNLPAGLSLDSATGQVAGVPTASSQVASFTASVADSSSPAETTWAGLMIVVSAGSAYTALPPTRLLDTRSDGGTLGPNSSLNLTVTGGGVPADATAVALNVTVTNTTSGSYLTVYPAGGILPLVSNLNWAGGETVPNLVIVPVGVNGQVTIYNDMGTTDVVVDLEGYFAPEAVGSTQGSYVPLPPARITDTRPNSGEPNAGKTMGPSGTLNIQAAGVGGVPLSGVSAVVLNVTVTDTTSASYLTAFPQGTTQPLASNLNWVAGDTVANRVVVPVNPSTGQITIYNDAGTADVVIDVNGYFTTGSTTPSGASLYTPIAPSRVLDTRETGQTLGPGGTLTQQMAGVGGIAASATAVVTNVTVVDTTADSYLTVYPSGIRPTASDVNWATGEVVPNLTLASLSSGGAVTVYNDAGSTDVVIDAFGYFSPG